jgi:hypothetical protein
MAKLIPGINFTGSLGNLSAYKMRGSDEIILRKKGGATKRRIKNDREFELTRRNNVEFSGRSTASKYLMRMLHPLKALSDYNIAGPLNALMKPIQELDTTSAFGERHVILSKNPGIVEGFSLNRQTLFESIVRAPITCSISRETLSAEVVIPALMPDINFKPRAQYPMYSFQVALGIVPDLFFSTGGYQPSHPDFAKLSPYFQASAWLPTLRGAEATTISLQLTTVLPNNDFTTMLSIGIRYGGVTGLGLIEQVKYAGAAKIVMLA